jgi:hypothetical protein
MRALVFPVTLLLVAAAATAAAQERESGYIDDYEDIGGVIVYPDTSAAQQPGDPGQGELQAEPDGAYAAEAGGPSYYFGPHPDGQGGWDPTEGPHAHDAPPFDPYLFTQENGYYYFIGDPVDFGYGGNDVYGYYGGHPIALVYGGGYCYYGGYHRHRFAPHGRFVSNNGWAVWNGPVSPWAGRYRERYDRYFHDVYPRHFAHGPAGPHLRIHGPGTRAYAPPVQRVYIPAGPGRSSVPTRTVPARSGTPAGPPRQHAPAVRDHRR